MDQAFINNLPKIDLHCHLDGSFSPEFIRQATSDTRSSQELYQVLQAPASCSSLTQYLTCFDLPISAIQTKENITLGVLDVLAQAHEDKVKYIELRFAPSCSMDAGLSLPDIYEAAITGSKQGLEKYGIHSNIILCAMRHHPIATNIKILDTMYDYLGHGICALDLAGDESMFLNQEFYELFAKARAMGIPFTIHSGECGSVDNVRLAVEYGASRIGHGIAVIKDEALMEEIKRKRIGLEVCPISNFQTKAWTDYSTYPLKTFLKKGILATLNTDNRTVSNTTMTKEINNCIDNLELKDEDFYTLYKNSVELSFADDNLKHQLLNFL